MSNEEVLTDFISLCKAEGGRQSDNRDLAILLVVPSSEMRYKAGERFIGDMARVYLARRKPMGARPTVRSFPLRTGKPGMFFWLGRRNRGFDVVAIVVGMCVLLAGAGCEEKEAAPHRRRQRSRLVTWYSGTFLFTRNGWHS